MLPFGVSFDVEAEPFTVECCAHQKIVEVYGEPTVFQPNQRTTVLELNSEVACRLRREAQAVEDFAICAKLAGSQLLFETSPNHRSMAD